MRWIRHAVLVRVISHAMEFMQDGEAYGIQIAWYKQLGIQSKNKVEAMFFLL
jgi:hypothetical protein